MRVLDLKRGGPWACLGGRQLFCAVAILGASWVAADEPSTESRVTACAGIPEGVERLACYDRLASEIFARAKPIAGTPAAPAPVAPVVSTAQTGATQTLATAPAPAVSVPAAPAPIAAAPAAAAPIAPAVMAAGVAVKGSAASDTTTAPAQTGSAQATFGLTPRAFTPAADAAVRYITARVTHLRSLGAGGFRMDLDNGQTWDQVESTDLHLQEGDSVKISRAALGSFWLTTSSHRGSRVKRVR